MIHTNNRDVWSKTKTVLCHRYLSGDTNSSVLYLIGISLEQLSLTSQNTALDIRAQK